MDAINILLDEHKMLLKAVETTKKIQKIKDDDKYYIALHDMILFFRNFSEIYHHPKEESVLYPALRNRSGEMSAEFLNEICDNHEDFKSAMAEIENAYLSYDYFRLRTSVEKYLSGLEVHIKKENKIILSVASKLLSKDELNEIAIRFLSIDKKNGEKESLVQNFYNIFLQFE